MSIRSSSLYMPCPCGSGKKFKFCCLEAVRSRLPDDPSESDITAVVRKVRQPWGMVNDVDPIEDREAVRLMEDGIAARDEGRLDEAIRLFRKSRKERPRLYASWNNEAQCLWLRGEVDKAVRVLEDGLDRSADVNAFGWGLLAAFRHCLDDGEERDRCIARAVRIRPMSADAACGVCQALALAGRHRELLDYALSSGFRDTPAVAAFGVVAALNCGFPDQARILSGFIDPVDPRCHPVQDALEADGAAGVAPSGGHPYFNIVSHPGGLLFLKRMSEKKPVGANLECDMVEMMVARRRCTRADALETLGRVRGPRAEALRAAIAAMEDWKVETSRSDLGDDLGDSADDALGDEMDGVGILEEIELTEEPDPDDPMTNADRALFERSANDSTAPAGSRKWKRALATFRDLLARYPGHYRTEFNVGAMLLKGGKTAEGLRTILKVADEHPDYGFANATALSFAVTNGDMSEAREIARRVRLPRRIHPAEYIAWLRAQRQYLAALGKTDLARNAEQTIRRIERDFGY